MHTRQAEIFTQMANGTLKALQDNENGIGQAEDNKVELLNKWRLQMYEDIT